MRSETKLCLAGSAFYGNGLSKVAQGAPGSKVSKICWLQACSWTYEAARVHSTWPDVRFDVQCEPSWHSHDPSVPAIEKGHLPLQLHSAKKTQLKRKAGHAKRNGGQKWEVQASKHLASKQT